MKRRLGIVTLTWVLLFSVVSSAMATTWAPAEVVCPICKTKNTFMQIVSFGNYIYHWPSKFQYIYWPMIDTNVLYSCKKCHYTAFMSDFSELPKDKSPAVQQMLAAYPFSGTYEKYTDIPMSQRLMIAEKVYSILERDDDWWCFFERVRGYHLEGEKKPAEALEARKKALSIAEKMLNDNKDSDRRKELLFIAGAMKYFLKNEPGALSDFDTALKLKFRNPKMDPARAEDFDQYLTKLLNDFIFAIHDEEKARTEPVWPHRVLEGHSGWAMTLAYSPDSSVVASADIDDVLILWNARTGELKHKFPNRNVIQSVAFSPDGKLLVSGGYNKTVDIWNVESRTLLKALEGHNDYVHGLAFSPDGKMLASGSWDDTIRLWDTSRWSALRVLEHPESVWSISFSPDGSTLASIDFKGTIRLWDTKTGNKRRQFSVSDNGGFVDFSPDGKLIATASKLAIALLDPDTGKLVRKLEGHSRGPHAVAFSPDGKRLASVAWDGTLRLWDVDSATLLQTLTERGGQFRDVAFSPDGQTIVTCGNDHTVRLWDVRPGVGPVKPDVKTK